MPFDSAAPRLGVHNLAGASLASVVYAGGIQEEKRMTYTTHGYMTHADLVDHNKLYDTGPNPKCPGHEEGVGFVYCSVNEQCPGDGWDPEVGGVDGIR